MFNDKFVFLNLQTGRGDLGLRTCTGRKND